MTFREAAIVAFDVVEPGTQEYPDQLGNIKCCGASVVMVDQVVVECRVCGMWVERLNGEWVVNDGPAAYNRKHCERVRIARLRVGV